jgi:dipeptidase D
MLQVPQLQLDAVQGAIRRRSEAFQQEFGLKEAGLAVTSAADSSTPTACLPAAGAQQLLDLLLTLPHGVIKNSHAVEGECDTSGLGPIDPPHVT